MHRRISEGWWRRWAGWSVSWLLGWLFLTILISDGPAYSPGGALSLILTFIFGMPILALAVRWSFPRISEWAEHTFKGEGWAQRKASTTAHIARCSVSFRATCRAFSRLLLAILNRDRWWRIRTSLAGDLARFLESIRTRLLALPANKPRSVSEHSDSATGEAVEVAETASGEKPQSGTDTGRRKAANGAGRKRRKVQSKSSTKKKRRDSTGKSKSATKKRKT